ncbi:Hemicentin1like [Caligus rogercresseyi]|uniref:Hemicentin1like n=1 Tax=Caligus rogercresseyi TaxID=217165 RepID=A0A7T8JVX9_CALRO|nr:Hemicentin1like [Caligus rogercresseyi]
MPHHTSVAIRNHTASTIVVHCLPGFNGGLSQIFVIDVFETAMNNTQILISSNKSASSDHIEVRGLTPESNYILSIKSVNERGESAPIYLGGKTEGYIHYLPVKNEFSRLPLLFIIIGRQKEDDEGRSNASEMNNRLEHSSSSEAGGTPLLRQHQPCTHCSRSQLLSASSPVERTVIRTFSVDKKRPICPICNPLGNTPYPD